MKTLIFALAALLLFSGPSFAGFICTPDTFTLEEKDGAYVLSGTIETPTPGYSYEIEKDGDGHVLRLKAPEGIVIQVIGTLNILHTFTKADAGEGLTLRFDKSYNWGETAVSCLRNRH